jgi:hypothetical protein
VNCHVKRSNKVYAAAQPTEEAMSYQQPMETYPADDTYSNSQSLAVSPQMYPPQPSCGCSADSDIQPAPWPDYDPAQQHDYMQFNGYLRANIGNLMVVEFSCGGLGGDCSMWEKTGVLSEVGDDYIVLNDPENCCKTCCDLNAIKFVNIIPENCELSHSEPEPPAPVPEPMPMPTPVPAPAPMPMPAPPAEADPRFNCNLYNTNAYNAGQYRNYMMP